VIPRTYNEVAAQLAKVAGHAGARVDDARVLEAVNYAQERLANAVDSVGSVARLRMCIYNSVVALPFEYEAAIYASLDREQVPVLGRQFEFLSYGPGHVDTTTDVLALVDRGEMPVTGQPCGKYLRVTSTEDERDSNGDRPVIIVHGLDTDGYPLRTVDGDGVFSNGIRLEINGDTAPFYSESTVLVQKITSIEKPSTKGAVDLTYRDPLTSDLSFGGRYWHWVTRPSYRIYYIPNVDTVDGTTLHVLARRRLIPITADTKDVPMLITNFPALRKGVQAYFAEEKADLAASEALFATAIRDLLDEKKTYDRSLKPVVETSHIVGAFAIPHVL
jgi:hypothetical protein